MIPKRRKRIKKVVIIIILLSILGGSIGLLIKTGLLSIGFESSVFTGISKEAWLGFWGSLIGSAITLAGIVITIIHENNKDVELRRLESQPIMMLSKGSEEDLNDRQIFKYALTTRMHDIKTDSDTGTETLSSNIKIPLHFGPVKLLNIGLNSAVDVVMKFSFSAEIVCCNFSRVPILTKSQETFIDISYELNETIAKCIFKDGTDYGFEKGMNLGSFAIAKRMFYPHTIEEIKEIVEEVYRTDGQIEIWFRDIYGNPYKQEHSITLYIFECKDNTYRNHVTFDEYSQPIEIKVKNKSKSESVVLY